MTVAQAADMKSDQKSVLHILEIYGKNLFEIDYLSSVAARQKLQNLSHSLMNSKDDSQTALALAEIRQFFSVYRTSEYACLQNSFEDFKKIVWNFANQLSEDIQFDNDNEKLISANLQELNAAVETNSLDALKVKSKNFIESYLNYQSKKQEVRAHHLESIKRDLTALKKQLLEAHANLNVDHLTGAHNRRSFEEYLKKINRLNRLSSSHYSLLAMDIDFFKKINDSHGHDVGDFILKECVKLLTEVFNRPGEIIARVGGEEFAVVLPNHQTQQAQIRAQEVLQRIRSEVFIQGDIRDLRFTISIGIAQLLENESPSDWMKRADKALYEAKNSGRNKFCISAPDLKIKKAA